MPLTTKFDGKVLQYCTGRRQDRARPSGKRRAGWRIGVMNGKWLDIGPDHAVAYVETEMEMERPDGRRLRPGQFPCWRVDGAGRKAPFAVMFNVGQFWGGRALMRQARAWLAQSVGGDRDAHQEPVLFR